MKTTIQMKQIMTPTTENRFEISAAVMRAAVRKAPMMKEKSVHSTTGTFTLTIYYLSI